MSCAEKAESLLGSTAEDKETTEQESRKPPEQEVGPFPPCPLTAALVSTSLLLSCMSSHASSHLQPPLIVLKRPLLSNLDTSFQQPFSPVLLPPAFFSLPAPAVCFPFPQKTPGADPASAPERTADSDESKAGSEDKTREDRSRTASPSSKTEPAANQRESALKQTELSSAQNSPKSECCKDRWDVSQPPPPIHSSINGRCFFFHVRSRGLQGRREAVGKSKRRLEIRRQGKQARYTDDKCDKCAPLDGGGQAAPRRHATNSCLPLQMR